MWCTDGFGNIMMRLSEHPDVISRHFNDSNTIDSHNQSRQYNLGMEKCWVTTNAYFQLLAITFCTNVCDTWKIADYHGMIIWTRNESDGNRSLSKLLLLMANPLNASLHVQTHKLFLFQTP
jgi:hypothetical protein